LDQSENEPKEKAIFLPWQVKSPISNSEHNQHAIEASNWTSMNSGGGFQNIWATHVAGIARESSATGVCVCFG